MPQRMTAIVSSSKGIRQVLWSTIHAADRDVHAFGPAVLLRAPAECVRSECQGAATTPILCLDDRARWARRTARRYRCVWLVGRATWNPIHAASWMARGESLLFRHTLANAVELLRKAIDGRMLLIAARFRRR